jgi:hypothetical protein
MDFREIERGGIDWIGLYDRNGWRALVNEVMNFLVPYSAGKFVSSRNWHTLKNEFSWLRHLYLLDSDRTLSSGQCIPCSCVVFSVLGSECRGAYMSGQTAGRIYKLC